MTVREGVSANLDTHLDTALMTWKTRKVGEENQISLFGVAQPHTYYQGNQCRFRIYDQEKMSKWERKALERKPFL